MSPYTVGGSVTARDARVLATVQPALQLWPQKCTTVGTPFLRSPTVTGVSGPMRRRGSPTSQTVPKVPHASPTLSVPSHT